MSNAARKERWDRLTNDEKDKIEEERQLIIEWAIQEEEKAMEKIRAEGRFKGGLDGYYPELKEISNEMKKKMRELIEKYGLNI